MARRQAEKALALVDDLDKTVRQALPAPPPQTITSAELHALFDEFCSLYQGVRVRFDGHPTFLVDVDLGVLRRVLDNCVSNAFKAGGSPWVLLTASMEKDILTLCVKDGGCGMSREQVARLGLGFSTTGGGQGTRLLLDLLTSVGGTIHWDSIPDVGTCVCMHFPAKSEVERLRNGDKMPTSKGSDLLQ
jgi:signal transduction histidine kinase